MKVSVVSGTYNRLPLLQRMVQSARDSAKGLQMELVIVDGGSKDDTIQWCLEQPDILLIEHGKLLGAIKAYNDGCEMAGGKYVVIGNDDVVFDKDTIKRAYDHMEANPEVGQVAFGHQYKRRGPKQTSARVQGAYGYPYGQCCMTRRWLGDHAGWWGDEGMRTYGGDTRLSLRLWEMGWPTVKLAGCSVIDDEHVDELRKINSVDPRAGGHQHPDLLKFNRAWHKRLPDQRWWIPAPVNRVLTKAANGNLRTMRFKGMMSAKHKMRHALIDQFAKRGPAIQYNNRAEAAKHGPAGYQGWCKGVIKKFNPDLVLFQAQVPNNVFPETVMELREAHPNCVFVNFDGDCHFPIPEWNFEIAKAVHLQLTVSPTLFASYAAQGIGIGYWPIGIELEYAVDRAKILDGPDVLFLGTLYGIGQFPEAKMRRAAVKALSESDLEFKLFGGGWDKIGITATATGEQHDKNANWMARSKMTLSISQAANLWGYTSDRLYNICATGCPALVQRFAGMEQHGFVDGETCIAWATVPEMLKKAAYYLAHPVKREEIGLAGQAMTLERHTWERRVDSLFAMLEGL